jgi:hypothetical protein
MNEKKYIDLENLHNNLLANKLSSNPEKTQMNDNVLKAPAVPN